MPSGRKREASKHRLDDCAGTVGAKEPVYQEELPAAVLRGPHFVDFASTVQLPIIVTENGIATTDDSRRVEYFQRALTGLKHAIDDGIDVRGYVAWSLLDNFEWMSSFEPKFGVVEVDLVTQRRTIKPSAAVLGNIARRNSL